MNLMPVMILGGCFLLGMPIAFSMILAVIPYFIQDPYISVDVIVQRLIANTETASLLAVPFFVTASTIMNYSGITPRLMKFADTLVGHLRGGLGHVNVLLSTLMGGISGSGAADAAMECKLLVPEMVKQGYDKDFSAAVTAASAVITPIIPPGMCLIIYAFVCEVSTGKMLASGIFPGILLCISMMICVHIISKKKNYAPHRPQRAPVKEVLSALKNASWALLLPLGLLLGLRIGMFTATEGGALMAVYALVVGKFVYKELKLRDLPQIMLESVLSTASVMLILCASNVFSYYLSWERLPQAISKTLIGLTNNKYAFLTIVNVLFLFLGMFLDGTASMIILAPLFAPAAASLGIDLVHFGLIMCLNITIGAVTPPFGIYLYLVAATLKMKVEPVVRQILPFIVTMLIVLFLVTFIPALSLFLPNLLF
jgi:tripartite ATP-independent transporter DctM subunit